MSTSAETAVVLDIEPVGIEFEMRNKAVEIQDMKLAIVCTEVERVNTVFETAGKGSVARRGVSDSDKVFVEAREVPRQGEKKFELDLVVAEKKGTLLVAGLPVPMNAGKSDALEDGVVVVVSPTVGIYSGAEIEGTPGYTVAVDAAAVDNKLNFGP
jgi:hypothetical protein